MPIQELGYQFFHQLQLLGFSQQYDLWTLAGNPTLHEERGVESNCSNLLSSQCRSFDMHYGCALKLVLLRRTQEQAEAWLLVSWQPCVRTASHTLVVLL